MHLSGKRLPLFTGRQLSLVKVKDLSTQTPFGLEITHLLSTAGDNDENDSVDFSVPALDSVP